MVTCKAFSPSRLFSFYWAIPYSRQPYDALRVYAFSEHSLYRSIPCQDVWLMPILFVKTVSSLSGMQYKEFSLHVENN